MVSLVVLSLALVVSVALLTPWAPSPPLGGDDTDLLQRYFSPSQIARSETFHDDIKWPSWLGLSTNLVLALALGFSPVGRRLVDLVRDRQWRWEVQVTVLVAGVSVVIRLVTLPLSAWGHRVASDYGLATQSWGEWLVDVLKALGITVALSTLGLLALVGLARRFSRTWFLPAAVGAAVAAMAVSFAYPVLFEPVFNSFTPLKEERLAQELVNLAERDDIAVSEVLVADASRRTTTLNAYVSGFGSTKRIVLYDTLVESAADREVALVVAHELGHADDDDVLVGTGNAAIGSGAGVVALFLLLRSERVRRPLRVKSAADPAVVPIVLALSVLVGLASAPVVNTISRQVEARADLHSLQLTGDPDTFIDLHRRLAVTNLSHLEPNPILSFWFDSHPATLDRLAAAETWRADHDAGQSDEDFTSDADHEDHDLQTDD
ncbi:MAG: M48 family metallopeptidase [Nocardioidaceae bacterium]